jgi:hypothetical protein
MAHSELRWLIHNCFSEGRMSADRCVVGSRSTGGILTTPSGRTFIHQG